MGTALPGIFTRSGYKRTACSTQEPVVACRQAYRETQGAAPGVRELWTGLRELCYPTEDIARLRTVGIV
jgi:hypothetical protein